MAIFTYAIGTDNKVYLSTDKGVSWSERGGTLYIRQREIYADPNYINKIYVGGGSDITTTPASFSTDAGLTFVDSIVNTDLSGRFLQFQTIDSATVYAASANYVAKSIDAGATFNAIALTDDIYPGASYCFAIYFYSTSSGFAGLGSAASLLQKLFRTIDGGATWSEVTSFVITSSTEDITGIASNDSGTQVIVTTTEGYYISDSNLENWAYNPFPNTGRSNIYKLSETNYYIAFFSYGNTSSFFYTTNDAGSTWNSIPFIGSVNDPTSVYQVDVYMYNTLEGHISVSNKPLLYTSNGGNTFTTSTIGINVNAFTVTEQVCDECPEGYTKDGEDCVKTVTYDATYSLPVFLDIVNGPNLPGAYGKDGLNLMQIVASGSLPLLGGGTGQISNAQFNILNSNGIGAQAPRESGYSPIAFNTASPIANTLWKTRLINVGIWADPSPTVCNPNIPQSNCTPVSFSWCVTPSATKTYLIGMAGDNEVRFKVDGLTYVRLTAQSGAVTSPFNYWHVFPIELSAGQHTITLEGYNFAGAASFGAEIYDISVADFKTQFCDAPNPTASQLEPYIIFSTKDTVGQTIPDPNQEGYPGEWTCIDGSEPSYCFGTPVCAFDITLPFVKCVYELTSCLDPEVVMYSSTDLSEYIGTIIKLDNEECWSVIGITDLYTDPVEVTVISSYEDCGHCLPSYKLINCKDNKTTIYTGTDLSAYVGPSKVIKVEVFPNECWQVGPNDKAIFDLDDVTVDGEPFTKCIDCNPTIYQLNNCFNNSNFILSDSDLAAVMGKTISIVGYPGLCFSVGEPTCDCINVTGISEDGPFNINAQATGIMIDGRNQYALILGGDQYFLGWNTTEKRWELTNQTTETLIGYCPLDITCPYSSFWINIPYFNVQSCSTVLYDITVDKVYPDCECCITKSCQ
jgi:hypothetical protein